MGFYKVGDAVIEKVFCSCGQELDSKMEKCPKCGKELIKKQAVEEPKKAS